MLITWLAGEKRADEAWTSTHLLLMAGKIPGHPIVKISHPATIA